MEKVLSTEDERKVRDRLDSDFQYITTLGYSVLGVFLQGSQNYGLHYEGSDIDTKAIIIPSLDDLIFNRKPISTTIILPSNEHIDIKDIRLMHDCFKKQNINFIEILFTDYKKINPKYVDLYQPMFDHAEEIARYNEKAAINCMIGMLYEKNKALCHPYPATEDKIRKYGYDPKQMHHIIRVYKFLMHYLDNKKYKECLIEEPKVRKFLVDVKKEPPFYSLSTAVKLADAILQRVELDKTAMLEAACGPKKEVLELMNMCQAAVIKAAIKSEMGD